MAEQKGDAVPRSGIQDQGHSNLEIAEGDEVNDTPIEQVRLTVPPTDNPSLPCLTFRTWVLGIISCAALAFLNQFFGYRQNSLSLTSVIAQIITLPVGKLMAATLPTKTVQVPLTNWSLSLNPGPFNLKEHVLITILAGCGSNAVYALNIVNILRAFYHRAIHPVAAILLSLTTQMLGYGWAGMCRKILVDSPYMWWPDNLISVSLFRALHEEEKRPKGGLSRLQYFLVVIISSFAYYIVPAFFAPSISAISVVCLIWKNSVTAQQIGSGMHGLGIGSFGLDWNTVVSFLGNPIASPPFAIVNGLGGFFLVMYVINPLAYWFNLFEAQKFPFFSSNTYAADGTKYNITRVMNKETFDLDEVEYNAYSKLHLSVFFAFTYGLGFATLAATISHCTLFHGKQIWELWKKTKESILTGKVGDIHTRLMKKNYESVPAWWFYIVMILMFGLALFACEGFGKQLQLPWWGLILACAIAFIFTLPIGVIQATTNQQIGLNIITELIIGYIYPGKPLANVAFKTYGYISMSQALQFVSDFKLGHYMKIPPKSMFVAQLIGTVVSSSVQFGTAWWLLDTVDGICDKAKLPEGSPWTCPGDEVFYHASIIWGVIGPGRMFTNKGVYPELNYFFLIGFLLPIPVWLFSRKFPEKKWIQQIHIPLILGSTMSMPPARSVNYLMWGAVGIYFNFYIYRKYKAWWARHTYVFAAGMNAGLAFMAVLLFFTLQSRDINGPKWWGLEADDHCPLATCPTAPGIKVKGCPVI